MNYLILTSLDYVIIGIILISVAVSFFRGFLKEAISLITWILAIFVSLKFSPRLSGMMHSLIQNATVRHVTASLILFVAVLILGAIINRLIHLLTHTAGLGLFDRLLGILFGATRGVLVVVVMLLVIEASSYNETPWAQKSILSPIFQPLVIYLKSLLPTEAPIVSTWLEGLSLEHKKINSTDHHSTDH